MRRPSTRHLVTSATLFLTFAGRPLLALPDSTGVAVRPTADSTAAPSVPAAGPRAATAAVGVRVPRSARETADVSSALAQQQRRHHGTSAALMIVGASAVVLGLLVGGDAEAPLIVGGAVAGFIGLYQYLR